MEEKKYLLSYKIPGDVTTYVCEKSAQELTPAEEQIFIDIALKDWQDIYDRLPPQCQNRYILLTKTKEKTYEHNDTHIPEGTE
jgi:hypothetical protein